MPKILAIDTASATVSVSLLKDDSFYVRCNAEANKHTECIISLIDEVLKEGDCTLEKLDAIAFGAGPGAFTGLRVACGITQGLAWAKNLPVICVSNLEAVAIRERFIGRILVALDARMHECYLGAYEIDPLGDVTEVLPPQLVKPDTIARFVEEAKIDAVAGSGFCAYAQEITLPAGVTLLHTDVASAKEIALRAKALLAQGKTTTSALAAPLYVRNRVALTIDQRAAGEKL